MARLKDIADKTGLSMNTISRALRDSGYVSEQARKKVLDAAAELGYKPNRAARSLRFRQNFEIAVINFLYGRGGRCDTLNMEKVVGMKDFFSAHGYELSLHFVYCDDELKPAPEKAFEDIMAQTPAGIILLSDSEQSIDIYHLAAQKQIPCVVVAHGERHDVDCVYIDRQQGVYDAVKYLIETGRKNICFAGYTGCSSRISGYKRALAEAGLPEIIVEAEGYRHSQVDNLYEVGRRTAHKIAALDIKVDAVQAYTDYLASGLASGFAELGLKVPEDVAIVGFDNRELAAFTNPPLSTIAQPNRRAGELAAEIVMNKINNKSQDTEAIKVHMDLIIRKSA